MEAIDGLAAVAIAQGDAQLALRLALTVDVEREARNLPRRSDECAVFTGLVSEPRRTGSDTPTATLAELADQLLREWGTG